MVPWQAVGVEILTPRDVPLGGLRAMNVRRTLPQRRRTFVGAWCFIDHYGPDHVDPNTGGMPIGVQLATGRGHESRLLEVAYELEQAVGFARIQDV